uniref:kinesin-like protein KIN-12C n=1 Tax=Erigeron canadensis TaxID=72917 RepID=UPI001CB9D46B|nr:kinesin-like protein KIN-12C [Erigeron canadensis]
MTKDSSKIIETDGIENRSDKTLTIPIEIPLSRTPLNTIPDPSQFCKEFQYIESGSSSNRRKSESAHSTPAKSVSRTTYVGQLGAVTGPRVSLSNTDRVGSSSRVSRRISGANCEPVVKDSIEVKHFELVEDPSFWNDHNVQVLIRIRPLSNTEKMAQGYGRCLKQESSQNLAWLGHPEVRFTFDHIVSETISQEKLFRVAGLPMVDNCMSGYNSCMFAYGQTGSGKTYTMMGEISQQDGKLVDDCGITPRLYEYLFMRIKLEEENGRDERLKYSCKCSFLEIYNEQITDLLEPSSTNLQLREGLKEGVYVENLTEHTVNTVEEVLKLLLQGAANRKVAGTDMNSESSRSHSVFTCIVESRREKDSVMHLRFGRLHLVDLAGSERQRSSGPGERLKEASYINKSLSTLGLVIMSLVDVAHGKHKHVPYRDSRLTFLLQDSLGGNSKTTIIANVSPSMWAANETLSTLKFAQRAKLIQNNAKVNEDASGDVIALQRQIQMLKEQMSVLMKRQNTSKLLLQPSQSEQKNQFTLEVEESYMEQNLPIERENQNDKSAMTLEEYKCANSKLIRKVDELNRELHKYMSCNQTSVYPVESVLSSIALGDGMAACSQVEDGVLLHNSGLETASMLHSKISEELMDTRTLLDSMKSQQTRLVEELQYVRQENDRLVETLTNNKQQIHPMLNHENHNLENGSLESTDQSMIDLQARLDKMTKGLEDLKLLNDPLRDQVDLAHEEVENEAAKAIINLQEELASLQVKYHKRLCTMTEENKKLKRIIAAKEDEVYTLHSDWEKASLELTSFLLDGSKSLKGASAQIESIVCSYPLHNVLVGEHVKKAVTVFIEKENTILQLEKNLVDAQSTIQQMQEKLNSLRTATLALTEIQYTEHNEKTKETNEMVEVLRGATSLEISSDQMQEKQLLVGHQIIDELVSINNRLDDIKAYFEDLDGSATDISTSSSILSDDDDDVNDVPEIIVRKQTSILVPEGGSKSSFNNQESDMARLFLKKQFVMAYEAFIKLDVQLAAIFKDKEYGFHSQGVDGLQNPEMQGDKAGFTATKCAEEKAYNASSFFRKFEEACTTMNEADNMLNALSKANEEAKKLSVRWKKTAKEAMEEKASLVEEIDQLKSHIQMIDEEHCCSLTEHANLLSMLEGSFRLMQREAEDLCHSVYSDALAMFQGVHHSIFQLRSSLQDICAETMEKSFASLVVQQCRIGEYINKYGLHEEIMENFKVLQSGQNNSVINDEEKNYSPSVARKETGELGGSADDLIGENFKLKKELERKSTLLNGLLFDFSLLQESTSTRKDIKDEAEKLLTDLSQVQHELKLKTNQLDDVMVGYEKLESRLSDAEAAFSVSKSSLQHSEETVDALQFQNAELRSLLEDLYLKKSETEKQLEEQKEIVKALEKEIHCTTSSAEEQFLFSLEGITDDFKRVSSERDELYEQIKSLKDKLEMAYAIADENEAIAVEARQTSEASKIYAEQKEEEVKVLENSVEELDSTVNVLEKKVNEMEEELERHHRIRDSLEVELQSLSQRLLTVETFRNNIDNNHVNQPEEQISRKLHSRYLELQEAQARIKDLEDERVEQANEIMQCKEYISELVIHAEAQAAQYQQKYKSLESMVNGMRIDSSKSGSEAPLPDKTEKSLVRARGSSSPFRCIGNLVQQMNTEKDQELSLAKLHLEDLQALASSRQKEICVLNTKLAAAESMTHDVIRDLLGVKLDMTNYANLINQTQLQRFIEDAAQQTQEFVAMEQEIRRLNRQITDLHEEKDRYISEINSKEADILACKMKIVQLQGRDHMLTAQNEMLKADKTNLQIKAAELDDMIKKLLGKQPTQPQENHASKAWTREFGKRLPNSEKLVLERQPTQPQSQRQENHMSKACTNEFSKRLANSEKLLLRVNNELAQYCRPDSPRLHRIGDTEKRRR